MIVTLLISGIAEFLVTCLTTVVVLPAASVATIVIVFSPSVNVTVVLNEPLDATVTLVPLTFTVVGDDVISFVVPATVTVLAAVINPSAGEVMFNVGGTVSAEYVVDFSSAAFPSLSLALILTVCDPSERAEDGVAVTEYPLAIAVVLMSVTAVPSILTEMVDALTPEPPASSTTVNVIGCLLFPVYAPEVGAMIVITA